MSLVEEIEKYEPYNEQEECDKQIMLDYINKFDNLLTRENKVAHFTASAWVVNKEKTRVLMIYHKIYNSWAWTGGHADGDTNLNYTAMREVKEETGVRNVKPLNNSIFSLEIIPVNGHIKRGKYVSSHLHLNMSYIFEVDESEELRIKEDENTGVKWIELEKIDECCTEEWVKEKIYKKEIEKLKKYI